LSYSETRKLLEQYNWDALFDKDQVPSLNLNRITLNLEGCENGIIHFVPCSSVE
jgi:hypothetical protein